MGPLNTKPPFGDNTHKPLNDQAAKYLATAQKQLHDYVKTNNSLLLILAIDNLEDAERLGSSESKVELATIKHFQECLKNRQQDEIGIILADLCSTGVSGFPPDLNKAIAYLNMCPGPKAQHRLANIYLNSKNEMRDENKGIAILQALADSGDAPAGRRLMQLHTLAENSKVTNKAPEKEFTSRDYYNRGLQKLRDLEAKGEQLSYYDYQQPISDFKAAAQLGNDQALFAAGDALLKSGNKEEGLKLLNEAAQKGVQDAIQFLIRYYTDPKNKNLEKAANYIDLIEEPDVAKTKKQEIVAKDIERMVKNSNKFTPPYDEAEQLAYMYLDKSSDVYDIKKGVVLLQKLALGQAAWADCPDDKKQKIEDRAALVLGKLLFEDPELIPLHGVKAEALLYIASRSYPEEAGPLLKQVQNERLSDEETLRSPLPPLPGTEAPSKPEIAETENNVKSSNIGEKILLVAVPIFAILGTIFLAVGATLAFPYLVVPIWIAMGIVATVVLIAALVLHIRESREFEPKSV